MVVVGAIRHLIKSLDSTRCVEHRRELHALIVEGDQAGNLERLIRDGAGQVRPLRGSCWAGLVTVSNISTI
jgi:hypothetical protein